MKNTFKCFSVSNGLWIVVFFFLVTLCLVTCDLSLCYAQDLAIDKVSCKDKWIDYTETNKAVIDFNLSDDVSVVCAVYNEDLEKVWEETQSGVKGKNQFIWPCTDMEGERVFDGAYIFTFEAVGKDGNKVLYNPAGNDWGESVMVEGASYDKEKSAVTFNLPKIARYRIRIGLFDDGPTLMTLSDWELSLAGPKEVPWDGKDPSGSFDLRDHPNRKIYISAYALPRNCVIIKTGVNPERRQIVKDDDFARAVTDGMNAFPMERNFHLFHKSFNRHEPKVDVAFLERSEGDTGSRFRIEIDKEDFAFLTNTRYEIMYYIDGLFVGEEEEGMSPYTLVLPEKELTAGERILTINIWSPEDYVAVKSVKFKYGE